jgi:CheY-like chemotaxis protein
VAGVVAVLDDLFFGAKLLEAARRLQVPLILLRAPQDVPTTVRQHRPALLIVDLQSETCAPLEVIRGIKTDPDLRATPVLGYVSHVRDDLMTAAADAGCDEVLPRSAFSARLPDILRRWTAARDGDPVSDAT